MFDPRSPIYRAPRAHPKLWPGAWQEVGEPVHYGWGHWQGSYVLVDLLQLTDYSAGHQLQHMMRKMEGHCCPLKEGGGVKCHRKGTNGYNKTSRKSSPEKEIYTCTSSKYCSYNKKHYKKISGDQKCWHSTTAAVCHQFGQKIWKSMDKISATVRIRPKKM